jgi:hypothetical protein
MAQIPAVFKITPFIKRAEELEKDTSRTESQLVAYYWCSSYSFFFNSGGLLLQLLLQPILCVGVSY